MKNVSRWVLVALLLGSATNAMANDPAGNSDLETTLQALKMRLQDQDRRLNELESQKSSVEEQKKKQEEILAILGELREDAAKRPAGPQWLEDMKLYGDLRLRYQGQYYNDSDNPTRNRARFRLRFGLTKLFLDKQMEVGFRLASGSDNVPTSTNQTFDDSFSKKPIWIDRAYAKYSPNAIKGLTVAGGKMGTPMVHTDMIWDSDVNPEGVWAQYKPTFGSFSPFVNVGYWMIEENNTANDSELASYQLGFDWKIQKELKWTFAATYYDYNNYADEYTWANGNPVAPNGELAAGQFRFINLTNMLSWKVGKLPMSAYFDFAHNCGDEDPNPEYRGQDNAYAVGITLGENKKKGDWSVGYKYAYIEADSVPGAFNDSDFGHSNRKGHVVGAEYNLTDFLTFGGRVFFTQAIAGSRQDEDKEILVLGDLVWKF